MVFSLMPPPKNVIPLGSRPLKLYSTPSYFSVRSLPAVRSTVETFVRAVALTL